MVNEYCQVLISVRNKKEVDKISDTLLNKKLIAGCLITKGHSKFWWKRKVIKKMYYNINAFSLMKNKSKIILEVSKISSDKCPITAFSKIDGNDEFLKWIKESVK